MVSRLSVRVEFRQIWRCYVTTGDVDEEFYSFFIDNTNLYASCYKAAKVWFRYGRCPQPALEAQEEI